MNPSAITKLRHTFIFIAMASFMAVIIFMGCASTIANIIAISGEADRTIDAIIDAEGRVPERNNYRRGEYHQEAALGLRFFTVSYNDQGEVTSVDLTHVASIDRESAIATANYVTSDNLDLDSDPSSEAIHQSNPDILNDLRISGLGRYDNYLFKEAETPGGSIVVFLDCSIQLSNATNAVSYTVIVCLCACVITFISVLFFSKRAIRPVVENAQRQQQFMTNASHELKTPIAVIKANTELTELMNGESEWTQSTLRQADRLERLVADLMNIVRDVEQNEDNKALDNVLVSDVVMKAYDSFKSVAIQKELSITQSINEKISLRCNPQSIEQLACLLIDNALKYCDEKGSIAVGLTTTRIGHGCILTVSNSYASGKNVNYHRFFERFYREDESHKNQQGYGIGLSVAESICKRYHGSIKASWKSGIITFTCVLKDA